MRFLIDQTSTALIAKRLRELGHEASTVVERGLGARADDEIFELARREHAILVTCDSDFSKVTRYSPAEVGGIIYIRSGNIRRDEQIDLVERFVTGGFFNQVLGALVTLYEDGTVRIWKV